MPSKLLQSLIREPDVRQAATERIIPFSESPFVGSLDEKDVESDVEKLERIAPDMFKLKPLLDSPTSANPIADEKLEKAGVPEWLGIFFDLSWTVTFSSLTSNTSLTDDKTVWAYGVFFILAWWLWAAQVIYDTKFYSNDWFHRFCLLAQLGIFGSLASFTKNFDPFQFVDSDTASVADFQAAEYSRKSMLGISVLFALSRVLLSVSYSRLAYYVPTVPLTGRGLTQRESELRLVSAAGRRSDRSNLIIQAAAYVVSALLFFAAFLDVKYNLHAASVVGKLFLWFSGVALEVGVYLFVSFPDERRLINEDTMGERLSTLTTVILGEGLNNLAGTLVLAAGELGFGTITAVQSVACAGIIFFSFLLYFEGFKRKTLSTQNRSKWNVLLHFPLHLALILLLEGSRNILLVSSVQGTVDSFIRKLSANNGTDSFERAFRDFGIDFNAQVASFLAQFTNSTAGEPTDQQTNVFVNQLVAKLYLNIFNTYQISDDAVQNITDYSIQMNGPALTDNLTAENSVLNTLVSIPINEQVASAPWILLSAAGFLLALSLITLVNSWRPSHRYVWGSILSRFAMATVIAAFWLVATINNAFENIPFAIVPFVAGAYVLQFIIDEVMVIVAVKRRSHSKRVASLSS